MVGIRGDPGGAFGVEHHDQLHVGIGLLQVGELAADFRRRRVVGLFQIPDKVPVGAKKQRKLVGVVDKLREPRRDALRNLLEVLSARSWKYCRYFR